MKRKKIAVLSGAGVSAESGISTFRDSNGLWENHKPEEIATLQAWKNNMDGVLDFYNKRRKELQNVRPNEAHLAIAGLEKDYDVCVITQNIDNLHERAGSSKIIHLHGELTKVRPEQGVYEKDFGLMEVFDIGYAPIVRGDLAPNGKQLRPHVVWFGEAVPNIEKAIETVSATDIFLIVGTSLAVYPAAGLYRYARFDTPIYLIDPKDTVLKDKRMIHIREKAVTGMQTFMKMINESE